MSLPGGSRLGVYEIVSPLGAGGMGEVYLAHDTRLGRRVAIKIILESLAGDPERHARFEREAKLLASLNHPHVAQVYGLHESGGTLALVMELVEGPTLAAKDGQRFVMVKDDTTAGRLRVILNWHPDAAAAPVR